MLGAGREDTHFSFSFLLSCSYKHSGLIANVTCHIKDNVVAVFTSILRLPKLTNENQKPDFFFLFLSFLSLLRNKLYIVNDYRQKLCFFFCLHFLYTTLQIQRKDSGSAVKPLWFWKNTVVYHRPCFTVFFTSKKL